ncbi:MAG TPA: pyrimidine reductase family protein [Trebonia sp.]|nr:pyrimidine reductase family protein [Trebonia sp.]
MRVLLAQHGGTTRPPIPPWPPAGSGELDDAALAGLYAYPRERWLRANFVSSADGAGFLDGLSAGLSSDDDRRLFGMLRVLADVVLVGAGTARAEKYKPARRPRKELAAFRAGRPPTPPIALVSRMLDLDLESPLFAAAPADARTIVITCEASSASRRASVAAVADVIVAGGEAVDLTEAVTALAGRGLGRVLCEGGPNLLAHVAVAGLLDELCLTVSPLLAGPGPHRIIEGVLLPTALPMTLAHVLEADGFLFCRYLTADS